MQTFKDNTDRTWAIEVNVDAVRRVKSALDINLAQLTEDLIKQLAEDPILLCDVVYCICQPEAAKVGVTDEDFGRAMAGESIDAAAKALMAELINFSRNPTRREILRKAMEKQQKLEKMGLATLKDYLESDKPEKAMREEMEKMMQNSLTPGDSSGELPESSESTPDR